MRRLLLPFLIIGLLAAGCALVPAAGAPKGGAISGTAGDQENPDRLRRTPVDDPVLTQFEQANGLLLHGEAHAAADLLVELAATAPDRWYIWNTLSLAYRRLDYLPAAASAGVRANYLKPGDPTVAFNTGVALTMAGRASEAIPLLRTAGTSADALYWLAVAQTAVASGPSVESRQTLQHLLTLYPDDKESRVAIAAQDQDLDMDQRVDTISLSPGNLTVQLSTARAPFELTWNPLGKLVPTAFQVVDARAPYPVLLLWSDGCVWIYQYAPEIGTLKQAAQVFGVGTWHYGTKILSIGRFDATIGQTTAEDWAWGENGWQMLRHFASGAGPDRPVAPPRSPVDLGAQLSDFPVRALFADDATWDAYNARWRRDIAGQKQTAGVFLLPASAPAAPSPVGPQAPTEAGDTGAYGEPEWQVEIWSDGQVLDRFAVDLAHPDGVFLISGLH